MIGNVFCFDSLVGCMAFNLKENYPVYKKNISDIFLKRRQDTDLDIKTLKNKVSVSLSSLHLNNIFWIGALGLIFLKLRKETDLAIKTLKNKVSISLPSLNLNNIFWSGVLGLGVYNMFDQGLSNFLALETLVHGTGPLGFIGISLKGADPNWGGGATGSSAAVSQHFINSSRNFFYVFKDSKIDLSRCQDRLSFFPRALCAAASILPIQNILGRYHAVLSGAATLGVRNLSIKQLPQGVIGGALGFFTPLLKFRFKPEEVTESRFLNDEDYSRLAYKTPQAISPIHLGVIGSFSQGLNLGMFHRMAAHPGKVLSGIALMACAVLLAKVAYSYRACFLKEEASKKSRKEPCAKTWKEMSKTVGVYSAWTTAALLAISLSSIS